MAYFILFYDVVDDFPVKRTTYRAQHLRQVQEAHDRGELLMAGALSDPCDRAVLVFRAPERAAVEAFARSDPLRHQRPGHALARPGMVGCRRRRRAAATLTTR